ncbi:alpha/beta fold hydrolase [Celeribacter neptunius]|uniref:Pimeloyl-ACP methyl ester carboxylesterase n=1 Tax=Celeribacter neptunius TaxID=588602 RepID=A0A1I3LLD3_9RHOB|nr:alpha/beta hydrolase [Celeribacter neptunius]SFI85609.1 Pimeloyl-ACP methyl ester carboxylesterase [Celeribacter neptunius]
MGFTDGPRKLADAYHITSNRGFQRALKTRRRGDLVKTSEGAQIHVEAYGQKDAPPVVLIHGASGSTYDMNFRLAPALAQEFCVYVVDRPGYGHSPRIKDESLAAQARTLRDAIRILDSRRPIVLGQSYGGAVALEWALQSQEVAALVLVSAPSHDWETGHPLLHRTLARPYLGWWAAELISLLVPAFIVDKQLAEVFAPDPVPEGYGEHFQPRNSIFPPRHRMNARQRIALKSEIATMVPRYPDLTLPIESLHGTADTIVPDHVHALPFDAAVESNRLTRLPDTGHMPHHVATEAVVQAVTRAGERAGSRAALH